MTSKQLLPAFVLLALFLTSFGSAETARAQAAPGITFGIGGQIGEPDGVSFKFYEQPDIAWDILLAFELEGGDTVFLNVHRAWERPLADTPLRYYYGPGAFIGTTGGPDEDDELLLGISFTLGLNYFIERFEIFANLTPRLLVIPATDGEFGGGVGLRYYF